jgi:hypothetical protein
MSLRDAGRVGPHRESHEPRLSAEKFTMLTPETGNFEWNGCTGIGEDWGMDGNDQYGDCGAAATDHYNMAKTQQPAQYNRLGIPKYRGTLPTYFAYGISQGEPGPEPDDGVDNASWFAFLYQEGIIDGYAEVPLTMIDWFAQQFRGVVLGLQLTGPLAISEFEQKIPWSAMPLVDGHDTLLEITHADGSGSLITWGGVQAFDVAFRNTNITDAWVVFDHDDPQVNWTELQQALNDIHGTDRPQLKDFLGRLEHSLEHVLERTA